MVVRIGKLIVIPDLHWRGLTVPAIAQRTGLDCKTVRKYIVAGLEPLLPSQLNETSRKRTVSVKGMYDDDTAGGYGGRWPRRANVAAAQA
jgi:hypothetical protein